MKIAVVGSREFTDYNYMKNILDYYLKADIIEKIITGDEPNGADSLAKKYAKKNELDFQEHKALWDRHGKAAGPIRNKEIVNNCEMVIAFRVVGAGNKGTNNTIEQANIQGKDVVICDYKKDDFEDIG